MKTAALVISCADHRLTVADSEDSWRRELRYGGQIYEVRVPGGALTLADNSEFSEACLASLRLLSAQVHIEKVVLVCHESCAYFDRKYGHQHPSIEREQHKHLMRIATQRLHNMGPHLNIVQLRGTFNTGLGEGFVQYEHINAGAPMSYPGQGPYGSQPAPAPTAACHGQPMLAPPPQVLGALSPQAGPPPAASRYSDRYLSEIERAHAHGRLEQFTDWVSREQIARSPSDVDRLSQRFMSRYSRTANPTARDRLPRGLNIFRTNTR